MARKQQRPEPTPSSVEMKGLPANLDTERFILGSILLDDTYFDRVASMIEPVDFTLEKHRRIYSRMAELHTRGEKIDRVTLAHELVRQGQLESCDGLAYLVSLDDGLPQIFNIESYARILREVAKLRRIIFASNLAINSAMDYGDSVEIAAELERSLMAAAPIEKEDTKASAILEQAIAEAGGIDNLVSPPQELLGISTGFPKLDEYIDGIQPEMVYVVGGATSSGKSAFAANLAMHLAASGVRVGLFSLEMRRKSVLMRIIRSKSEVARRRMIDKQLTQEERLRVMQAMQWLQQVPLFIDDTPEITTQGMLSAIRRMKAQHGVSVVIVDYIQQVNWRMGTDGDKHREEYDGITDLCNGFQRLIRKEKISGVLVSQLRRREFKKVEEARPRISDLHGSSQIEKAADVILLLFSPKAAGSQDPQHEGVVELGVCKQRDGMITPYAKWIPFRFEAQWTRFYDQ